ncbi:MAG: S1 family peptidase, partial [bacterium]
MALDLGMMLSAVRITGSDGALGTGFLMTVPSEAIPGERYGYLLTAHHVIAQQTAVWAEIPDAFGEGDLYDPFLVRDWRQPLSNVDLAIAPIPDRPDRNYQALQFETHVLVDDPPSPFLQLGRDVHYIGILAPLNRPMVRTGALGALHQTGIDHKGGYVYPAHLADCRSYAGFSGSPCFLNVEYAALRPSQRPPTSSEPPQGFPPLGALYDFAVFCGMFTQHLDDEKKSDVVSRYGVGVMLRAEEIREALMTEENRKERRKWDAGHETSGPQLENESHEDRAD